MLASGRRNQNSIWYLCDDDGNIFEDESALKELGQKHFAHIFHDDKKTCLLEQLKVVMLYPNMISNEGAHCLSCPVSLKAV